ncbi:MAG: DNA polymerase domain-containing protein, partial [Candidatus Aenigmatarchaeota archaeon]
ARIKEELAEAEEGTREYNALDNRQSAEKILANSFYGYLGYEGARWYSRECAEATTYLGRKYIQESIELAEEEGYKVVYGDSLDYSRQIVLKNKDGEIIFRKIGDFVEEEENHQDYKTLAFDERSEKVEFMPVKRAIAHEYEGEILRFDTTRGRTKVTPQHSVYAYDKGRIKLADAKEISEGD